MGCLRVVVGLGVAVGLGLRLRCRIHVVGSLAHRVEPCFLGSIMGEDQPQQRRGGLERREDGGKRSFHLSEAPMRALLTLSRTFPSGSEDISADVIVTLVLVVCVNE